MPSITIQISNQSPEKKKAIIEKLTAAAAEATGIDAGKFVVFISEHETDSIGVGGKVLKDMLAGK
ncbi:MAG: 4-oxalocrotonate tautomerase DmpI [Deferribacterales bacterium]